MTSRLTVNRMNLNLLTKSSPRRPLRHGSLRMEIMSRAAMKLVGGVTPMDSGLQQENFHTVRTFGDYGEGRGHADLTLQTARTLAWGPQGGGAFFGVKGVDFGVQHVTL
jgi:hypothetical protein